ncbi:MAG: efflux RND transporter periplasmic adaptor subunit [Bacteroidota bacterium]|nr:efflux RND transporter periplasmic adaptor subunit [Bacteroidota bacterium]
MNRLIIPITLILLLSCNKNKNTYDASGTFEAVETIVSSEATGILKQFNISEGNVLKAGETIGIIDSTQLYLKKKQLIAQIKTTLSQKPDIDKQLAIMKTQLKALETEQKRVSNLLKADAATQKQMDDINAQVDLIKKQMEAHQSTLGISTESINQQTLPLYVQIEQINDQLAKCIVRNPLNGTVLTKYAEANEMAISGKPLYKIADLSSITLRAYISGAQLASIKLNQQVSVLIDEPDGTFKEYKGIVEWISNKAEFTPKTIQTKDERANLVYAIKIRVKNDGFLKIGMYADVKF